MPGTSQNRIERPLFNSNFLRHKIELATFNYESMQKIRLCRHELFYWTEISAQTMSK